MAQIEILKMLSVSAVNMDRVPGGSVPQLVASDVAAMLASASRPVTLLAYAKYVQDQHSLILLASHVYSWAADLAVEEGWKITRGRPIIRNMSHLAVAESIFPGICKKCCGRGFTANKACPSCSGSGRKSISDCYRADLLEMDKRGYVRCWRDRYERIYEYIQSLDADLKGILYRNSCCEEEV